MTGNGWVRLEPDARPAWGVASVFRGSGEARLQFFEAL